MFLLLNVVMKQGHCAILNPDLIGVGKIPLALLGFSTDSAGFSLHASVTSITPTELHVKEGVFFLRLGIAEERLF